MWLVDKCKQFQIRSFILVSWLEYGFEVPFDLLDNSIFLLNFYCFISVFVQVCDTDAQDILGLVTSISGFCWSLLVLNRTCLRFSIFCVGMAIWSQGITPCHPLKEKSKKEKVWPLGFCQHSCGIFYTNMLGWKGGKVNAKINKWMNYILCLECECEGRVN